MKTSSKIAAMAALLTSTALVAPAEASHFRGGALVPSVSATGLMTTTWTSFWRKGAADSITPSGHAVVSDVLDTTDARFDKRTIVATRQLTGAGTYTVTTDSCCRVTGIHNWDGFGSSSVGWQMDSRIVWDGQNANAPILFDFSAIQPEVVRPTGYADNLGATSGNSGTLSYNQVLNGIPVQPPGFTVNTATGALTIPASSTNGYLDNNSNLGADYAFSGNIINSDGSSVEFDWLFDAVNVGVNNLAPIVTSHVINALLGDTINVTVTGTDNVDAIADLVTLSMTSFVGPGVNLAASFVPGAAGDPTTGDFTWDSTGSALGTYIALIRGFDGSVTDNGTITINICQSLSDPLCGGGGTSVPEPMTMSLLGAGLMGAGYFSRRRRAHQN